MRYWQDFARIPERALFDGISRADVTGLYDIYGGTPNVVLQVATNDRFTLESMVAAVIEHRGFGVTGAILYLHPWSFARLMSSFNHHR